MKKKRQPAVIKKPNEKQVKREVIKLDKLPVAPEGMTERQKAFCRAYVYDWNAKRAAIKAGYAPDSAHVTGSKFLANPIIKTYIDSIKNNLEELTGISRLKVANEYAKMAFTSIAKFHKTWIDKKDFDKLTPNQKAAIESIEYRTHTYTEHSAGDDEEGHEVKVEQVKIKLFDKIRALEAISRMLGYDAPIKIQGQLAVGLVVQVVDDGSKKLMEEVAEKLRLIDGK